MSQGDIQASVRSYTGTSGTYEGDFHALFDQAGIQAGAFNGRLLAYINQTLGSSYTEINGAMWAYAQATGAASWGGMSKVIGSWVPTGAAAFYDFTSDRGFSNASVLSSSVSDLSVTRASIGLSLDVEVASAGANAELVANGGFDNGKTGWIDASTGTGTFTVSGGVALLSGAVSNGARARQALATVVGRIYAVTGLFTGAGGNDGFSIGTTAGGSDVLASQLGVGAFSAVFIATATTTWFSAFGFSASVTLDNVSVKEIGAEVITVPAPFTATATAANVNVQAPGALIAGRQYTVTYTLASISGGSISINVAGGVTTAQSAPGTYTEVVTPAAGNQVFVQPRFAATVSFNITALSIKDTSGVTGYLRQFPANVARRTTSGLLIEEARTNLVKQSASLSTSPWTLRGVTLTAGPTGPDGVGTLSRFIAGGNGVQDLFQTVTGAGVSARVEPSFWLVKNQSTGILRVVNASAGGTGGDWRIDLATFPAGLNRVTRTSAGVSIVAEFTSDASGNCGIDFMAQTGTVDVSVGYVQLEPGAFATSYIPTTAGAATRAADTVLFTGNALAALQGASGTAIVETGPLASVGANSERLIGDGNTSSANAFILRQTANSIASLFTAGNVPVATLGTGGFSGIVKSAAAWAPGNRDLCANGGTVATSATSIDVFQSARLGSSAAGGFQNGPTRKLTLYSYRLSSAELQAATT